LHRRRTSFAINSQHLGAVEAGYFRVNIPPGKHIIDASANAGMGRLRGSESRLIVLAEAGEVLFVGYADNPIRVDPRGILQQADALKGETTIRKIPQFVGNYGTMNTKFQTKEDLEWEACAATMTSCPQFLSRYPDSEYAPKVRKIIADKKKAQEIASLKSKYDLDAGLPSDVRRDKYMIALSNHLKSQQYPEALVYFEWIERLGADMPPSFDYFYGEALLRTGDPAGAITKLYAYLRKAGAEGKYYTQALELVSEAELAEF
jgi:hypothetical protein